MTCTLIELAAASNAVVLQSGYGSVADVLGTFSSGASAGTLSGMTVSAATGTVTCAPGDYALAVYCQEAAAAANTWNPGSGWANLVNDGGTSSVLHTAIDYQSGIAASSSLTETAHWTTDASAYGCAILVAFAPQTGATEVFTNQASTTISSGGTTTPAAGTPEFWTAASWSSFPAANNAQPQAMFHVYDPAAPSETIAVLNTATSLVIRGADGTSPVAHTAGFTVRNVISSGYLSAQRQDFVLPPPTGNAATDSVNIRSALNAAWSSGPGGRVCFREGLYVGDAHQFWIPPSVTVVLGQATQWQINCSAGSAVDAISVDEGASIRGDGSGAGHPGVLGQIHSTSSVNCRSLIANHVQIAQGGQEYFYLDSLFISAGAGTFAVAAIDMDSCFTNSGLRMVILGGSGSIAGTPGLLINGGGPVWLRNCSFGNPAGDNVYVKNGVGGLYLDDCELDHPADGYHHLHLDGSLNTIYNVRLTGFHTEDNIVTSVGPSAAIKADGVHCLTVLDWGLYAGQTANKVGLWVTAADNQEITLKGVKNVNGVSPVIRDDQAGTTTVAGAQNIFEYNGPGGSNASPKHYGQFLFGAGDLRLGSQSIALASTAVDAGLGNIIDVAALAAGVTVAAPLNPEANQLLVYKFVQNGTGGFAVAWNAVFRVASGVVSTTASKASVVAFRYDSSLSAWVQMWATTGV